METIGSTPECMLDPFSTAELNGFIRHSILNATLSRGTAIRLLEKSTGPEAPIFEDDIPILLATSRLPEGPVAPGLRKCEDFNYSEEVWFRQEEKRSTLQKAIVCGVGIFGKLHLEIPGSAVQQFVSPTYPGLVKNGEHIFYTAFNRGGGGGQGDGAYPTMCYSNLELTRLLSRCNSNDNLDQLIARMKRMYQVNIRPYRLRPNDAAMI